MTVDLNALDNLSITLYCNMADILAEAMRKGLGKFALFSLEDIIETLLQESPH